MTPIGLLSVLLPILLGLSSLLLFVMAIKYSYVLEALKDPDRKAPPKMTFRMIFTNAFAPPPTPKAAPILGRLRARLLASMALLVSAPIVSQILRHLATQAA